MDAPINPLILLLLASGGQGGLNQDVVNALLTSGDAMGEQLRQLVSVLLANERAAEHAGADRRLAEEVANAFARRDDFPAPLSEETLTAFPRLKTLLSTLPQDLRAKVVGIASPPVIVVRRRSRSRSRRAPEAAAGGGGET